MNNLMLFTVFIILATSAIPFASAAQLDASLNPENDRSYFTIKYLKTIYLKYPEGGKLSEILQDKEHTIWGSADITNPGVKKLADDLNKKIALDGSWAQINELSVNYEYDLKSIKDSTSIDYNIEIQGFLSNYVRLTVDDKKVIDLAWRGLSTNNAVIINGDEINFPINTLKQMEPEAYEIIQNTPAEIILQENLINGDFILEQPMKNWHSLFDPTGISVDAKTFGMDKEISGFIVTSWTMGESSIREGPQTERVIEQEFTVDKNYLIKTIQSADSANLSVIGYGIDSVQDGTEIATVTPKAPKDAWEPATGDFPTHIILGMAAMAAIGGVIFFIYSKRSLKNQTTEQTGIDPTHLVSYETSSSAGGYKTNRGESFLKSKDGSSTPI